MKICGIALVIFVSVLSSVAVFAEDDGEISAVLKIKNDLDVCKTEAVEMKTQRAQDAISLANVLRASRADKTSLDKGARDLSWALEGGTVHCHFGAPVKPGEGISMTDSYCKIDVEKDSPRTAKVTAK